MRTFFGGLCRRLDASFVFNKVRCSERQLVQPIVPSGLIFLSGGFAQPIVPDSTNNCAHISHELLKQTLGNKKARGERQKCRSAGPFAVPSAALCPSCRLLPRVGPVGKINFSSRIWLCLGM